jgi:polyisoprenoid-binding protein YceI
MKKALLIPLVLLLALKPGEPTRWKLPANATASFAIRGLFGTTVHGTIRITQADLLFDPAELAKSTFNTTLEVRTLSTGISLRDEHLMKKEYFDPDTYPRITFRSTSMEKSGDGHFIVKGNLTMKGVERPQVIPFDYVPEGSNARFRGRFTVNRLVYGVGESSANMGDNVTVILDLPVTRG